MRGEALTWGLLPIVLLWRELPRVDLAKRIGGAALVAVAVLSPWTIRNAIVMDAFVPVAEGFACSCAEACGLGGAAAA